ncbi:MAG: hypothetical protein WAW07_07390 [Bacteroidales bacterium]
MTARISLLIFFLTVSTAVNSQQRLSEGDFAPGFKDPADDGMMGDIHDYPGTNHIVIDFYPATMTGGEIAKEFGVPASEGGTIKRTFSCIEHDLTRGLTASYILTGIMFIPVQ